MRKTKISKFVVALSLLMVFVLSIGAGFGSNAPVLNSNDATKNANLVNSAGSSSPVSSVVQASRNLCGDVNNDGRVDVNDVRLISQHTTGSITISGSCADVNGDGRLTVLDTLIFGQYFSGTANLSCPASCGGNDLFWGYDSSGTTQNTRSFYVYSNADSIQDIPSVVNVRADNLCRYSSPGGLQRLGSVSRTVNPRGWQAYGQNFRNMVFNSVIVCGQDAQRDRTIFTIVNPLGAPDNLLATNDVLNWFESGTTGPVYVPGNTTNTTNTSNRTNTTPIIPPISVPMNGTPPNRTVNGSNTSNGTIILPPVIPNGTVNGSNTSNITTPAPIRSTPVRRFFVFVRSLFARPAPPIAVVVNGSNTSNITIPINTTNATANLTRFANITSAPRPIIPINTTNTTNTTNRTVFVPSGIPVMLLPNSTNSTFSSLTGCNDTDSGNFPLVRGTVITQPPASFTDYCQTPSRLREFYCATSPISLYRQDYTCLRGCSTGRCNP